MRQPFSVNKLAKKHNRDSRTSFIGILENIFRSWAIIFSQGPKVVFLTNCAFSLNTFYKITLKPVNYFRKKFHHRFLLHHFSVSLFFFFFLVAVMFGFSFPGSFFISCSQSLHVPLKPIYFASVCDFFDLYCYNFISLLFCVHFS